MDDDRIVGSVKETKGTIKETVGKALGDAKLQAEGKSDKAEGKVQNAVGGLKDALKEWSRRQSPGQGKYWLQTLPARVTNQS